MNIRITVDRTDLDKYLEKVVQGVNMTPDATDNILTQVMNIAQGLAQVYAPVSTGVLRDNIHLEKKKKNVIELVSNPVNEYGKFYAIYPEYGFGQTAQSYIGKAIDEIYPELIANLRNEVTKLFEV